LVLVGVDDGLGVGCCCLLAGCCVLVDWLIAVLIGRLVVMVVVLLVIGLVDWLLIDPLIVWLIGY
jgi:hypothetical protein